MMNAFSDVYGRKMSEDTKHFDLGGVTITVTRYGYNRIDISRYVCNIKSEKFDYKFKMKLMDLSLVLP